MSTIVILARDPHPRFLTDIGDPVKQFFSLKRDENGNCIYKLRDEVNIQEDIDSYRDGCSLEQQLFRMNLMPVDQVVSSLCNVPTVGADVSNIPTDLMEYLAMFDDLKSKIPDLETKLRTMSFNDIVKSLIPKNPDIKISESEVNDNGSNESGNA